MDRTPRRANPALSRSYRVADDRTDDHTRVVSDEREKLKWADSSRRLPYAALPGSKNAPDHIFKSHPTATPGRPPGGTDGRSSAFPPCAGTDTRRARVRGGPA